MPRLLIVDDHEQDRYLLRVLLEKSGYSVDEANDGAQALTKARTTPPDMIVSDILMPVMDGFNLCREWRKDEQLRTLPFIFYTATYTDPRDEELALKSGADKFIVKPIEPVLLLETLKEVLGSTEKQARDRRPPADQAEPFFKTYSEALIRKLEDKLELFRTIFTIDPSAIFLLSPASAVLELNRAAENLLGVRAEEVFDKNFIDTFITEPGRAAFKELIQTVLDGSAMRNFESGILMLDGSEKSLLWNAQRLRRASGAVEGVLLIGHDITAQKHADQQRSQLETQLRRAQKMEAIGTFASGIAHDFNNILTGLMGFVDLARYEQAPGSRSAEFLKNALLAAERAKNLVRKILSVSRHTEEGFRPVELAPIIIEACKLLRASIPKSIDLKLNIANDCGALLCDPTQIHQVLMNLCTNAYHAIETGQGTITVSCHALAADKNSVCEPAMASKQQVVIEVSDTGTGMCKATLAQIFKPYFTTKPKEKGTGLGLPVVQAIVKAHGGRIEVESTEGKGSIFRVLLPNLETGASHAPATPANAWEFGNNESILLVEDDETNGPMLASALDELRYQVTHASDGAEAFARLAKNPFAFDLVITDLTMPNMGGMELAQKVHAMTPELPIVLMSGTNETLSKEQMNSLGISAFLKKPFTIGELSQTLKSIRKRSS